MKLINLSTPAAPVVTPVRQFKQFSLVEATGARREEVWKLRYRAYYSDGHIPENATKRFFDEYDEPNLSHSYLAIKDADYAGSMRVCKYRPGVIDDVPAMEIFEAEISDQLDMKKPFVEINKFVIAPEYRRKGGVSLRFALAYQSVETAIENDAQAIIIAVRDEHQRFYNAMGYKTLSDSRRYPKLNFDTRLLACFELEELRARLESRIR